MRFITLIILLSLSVTAQSAPTVSDKSVFAFPNPARIHSTLRFEESGAGGIAEAVLYAIDGREVRRWVDAEFSRPKPGVRHAKWNLTNKFGQRVSSGVYLWALTVRFPDGTSKRVISRVAVVR